VKWAVSDPGWKLMRRLEQERLVDLRRGHDAMRERRRRALERPEARAE